ncbi:MAG TPA: IPT/TIG domain-containing protein [Anaerolineales bacterium]
MIRTPLFFRIFSILLMLGLLAEPIPALAAPGISGVQPSVVSSNSSVDLVITGADFVDGAAVILDNYGALSTTFVSATMLRAMLPAGISSGKYTVTVVNPDSSSASLPNALTVTAPTATLPPPSGGSTPTPFARPLVVVSSYSAGVDSVTPTLQFKLVLKLENTGQSSATNVVVKFASGDFTPRNTGGVLAFSQLEPGERQRVEQPLTAGWEILGKTIAAQSVTVTYTDLSGAAYNETFTLTLPVTQPKAGPRPTTTPTPTAAPTLRPQLVINKYASDVLVLQPGTLFTLSLTVNNVGNAAARRVTMILGGGSSTGGSVSGTPDLSGGVSGASGDFGNFAPVASSNVQFMGDVSTGDSFPARASLIVNASANPGAYPMKISFTYVGDNGVRYTDDQVITLLVYALPKVEVNFYRDPGQLMAGQPNQLPLQVVNMSRKATVLGTMKVDGQAAQFSNNSSLVGALDPGGYFTMDAMAIPNQPGPLELQVTIEYTDDFNQAQVITKTLTTQVQEAPIAEPGSGNGLPGKPGSGEVPVTPANQPETFLERVWRLLRGLLGLDSAQPTPGSQPGQTIPGESQPNPGTKPGGNPMPVPAPGKG